MWTLRSVQEEGSGSPRTTLGFDEKFLSAEVSPKLTSTTHRCWYYELAEAIMVTDSSVTLQDVVVPTTTKTNGCQKNKQRWALLFLTETQASHSGEISCLHCRGYRLELDLRLTISATDGDILIC
ncbi:hypothetical protein KGM_204115 [Danaus plexippus plexippus]|uniref:Uncharacterized protein n=1 Tax=Danaus plexippus plexippus TaxID=278856 RepID=A0A212EM95_DANPL|nr:hypothetical protein KGM_204115 [Danaus plexippus plexippus]